MAANRTAGTHSAPRTDFGNWGKISGSAELPGSCGRYSSFGTTDDRYNKNDLESAFVPPNLPHVRILEVAADCGRAVAWRVSTRGLQIMDRTLKSLHPSDKRHQ